MMTERPMFPVPHRSVLVGISLLALWVALTAGFVATTSRAPAPTDFERPCGHANGMTVHRLEAERSLALQRDLAAQARGRAYAERLGWMTPGLLSTPVVPSSTVDRRVHEIDVTLEALGARDEALERGETIRDGHPLRSPPRRGDSASRDSRGSDWDGRTSDSSKLVAGGPRQGYGPMKKTGARRNRIRMR